MQNVSPSRASGAGVHVGAACGQSAALPQSTNWPCVHVAAHAVPVARIPPGARVTDAQQVSPPAQSAAELQLTGTLPVAHWALHT